MKLFLTSIAASSLLAVLAMAEPPRPRYTVKDLGTFGGPGTNSAGYDMNNAGWVAGSGNLTPGGPQHAFVWYGGGALKDLGTLGGPNSGAGGPNASGDAAVGSEISKADPNGEDFCGYGTNLQCLAAIWKNGRLMALPNLQGGNNANAFGLNNSGQVVGFAETGVLDASCSLPRNTVAFGVVTPSQVLRFKPVIWGPRGEIRELRLPPGDTVGFAFGINNAGQAVGTSGVCSNTSLPPLYPNGPHAVLWDSDGSPTIVGENGATAINDQGVVAGSSVAQDGTVHPFVWTRHTGIQDLGAFPKAGVNTTIAPCCDTINNRGDVAGFYFDDMGPHAFVWRDKTYYGLNDHIPADSPLYLLFAESINDAGQITGIGVTNTGEIHAFLASPRIGEDGRDKDGKSPVVPIQHLREMLQQRLRHGQSGAR